MEIIQNIESTFNVTIPQELKEFWNTPYNKAFKLYSWRNTLSILDPAECLEETTTLNDFFPREKQMYFQVYTLLAFAKENEDDHDNYLAYGFDKTGENIGLYLWNVNSDYEHPVFIANSVTDLISHHVITLKGQENLQFDNEKYLNETFEKFAPGYILPLNFAFKTFFEDSSDIYTDFKKLVTFYETAFKKWHSGSIKFEAQGELITISIEMSFFKMVAYNAFEYEIIHFIDKINGDLNSITGAFNRPPSYGFYRINNKYVACLRLDIATDLIQKGFIYSRSRVLPMMAFYNPRFLSQMSTIYQMLTEFSQEKNEKITWL